MDALQLKLCDIQGRLFELSADKHCSSRDFVETFMKSEVAKALDSSFNHMQWAGEEYLFDELVSSHEAVIQKEGQVLSKDILFWVGYTYRYWSFYSGETSNQIYKIANADTMFRNYMMFHAFDPVVAIENLKEIHRQKKV